MSSDLATTHQDWWVLVIMLSTPSCQWSSTLHTMTRPTKWSPSDLVASILSQLMVITSAYLYLEMNLDWQVVTDTGRVWTWGRCEGGRLGYFPLQYSQDESSMSQDSGSGSIASISCKSDKSAVKKKRRSLRRSSKKLDTFLENGFVAAVPPNNVQTVPKRVEQMEGQFVAHVSCTASGCMALGRKYHGTFRNNWINPVSNIGDRVFGEYLHKLAAKTENWIPSFLEKLFSLLEYRRKCDNYLYHKILIPDRRGSKYFEGSRQCQVSEFNTR